MPVEQSEQLNECVAPRQLSINALEDSAQWAQLAMSEHATLQRRHSLPGFGRSVSGAKGTPSNLVRRQVRSQAPSPRGEWHRSQAVTFHPDLEVPGKSPGIAAAKQSRSSENVGAVVSDEGSEPLDLALFNQRIHGGELTRRATLSSLASRLGIGGVSTSSPHTKSKQSSGGTPSMFRRQNGNQPASSPALRHVPGMFVNRVLNNKRSPEPPAASPNPSQRSARASTGTDVGAVSDMPPPSSLHHHHDGVRSEGLPSSHDPSAMTGDAPRADRTNSLTAARSSMLNEIRSKVPKLKMKGRYSGKNALQPSTVSSSSRERSNSTSSADNVSQKSGVSGDRLSFEGVSVLEHDESMASLTSQSGLSLGMAGDETDSQERMQFQIRQIEDKLRSVKQELRDLQKGYVDDLSRENSSVEGQQSGLPPDHIRRKMQFEAHNKRYKADEQKLLEKIAKYEDKLNRLTDRNNDHSRMQGVKDHVSHLRRSMKSGLAQAQGGLHVPSFGKIFGSNTNIDDDTSPPSEISPQRPILPDNFNWDSHVAEVHEVRSRTLSVEEAVQQLNLRVVEAGDGQEKQEENLAKLTADYQRSQAEQKEVSVQLAAAHERVSRLEAEINEMANSMETRMDDTLHRLQNAQLQMAERCQEIDETVERCEARVSELEHRGRQALSINDVSDMKTSGAMVAIINTIIAVLYTLLSYWLKVQHMLPPRVAQILPYVVLLLLGILSARLFRV